MSKNELLRKPSRASCIEKASVEHALFQIDEIIMSGQAARGFERKPSFTVRKALLLHEAGNAARKHEHRAAGGAMLNRTFSDSFLVKADFAHQRDVQTQHVKLVWLFELYHI